MEKLRLVAITDPGQGGWEAMEASAARALEAGLPALMLRDPEAADEALEPAARRLRETARRTGALLIVNRRPALARRIGADGVHLGARGPGIAEAREALGASALIGYSAHEEEEALAALAGGADYVTFSPVFATASKPGQAPLGVARLQALAARAPGRVVALGGIDEGNAGEAMRAGALGVAVIRAIFQNRAGEAEAVRNMLKAIRCVVAWIVCAAALAAGARAAEPKLVTANGPWQMVFFVDRQYPYQFMNGRGDHLFVLNKTAWAFFGCKDPQGFLERSRRQGITVLRVALEGRPYYDDLKIELWPWGGTREKPDWESFNEAYWDEVERRVRMAGERGIGLDVVLYFTLKPEEGEIAAQRKYWAKTFERLGKFANVFTWEVANEYTANEKFQDAAGVWLKEHDAWGRPVCTSDGTTDDAVWPQKAWVDIAINHSCTGSGPQFGLRDWYLAVARNTRSHGKPAWCNESGREVRHKNDDPVARRKQGWLWSAAGCFWTYHSWEGCEGIDDPDYRGPGGEFLATMAGFWQGDLPFWKLDPCETVVTVDRDGPIAAVLADAERKVVVAYFCTEESGGRASGVKCRLRLPAGNYRAQFTHPSGKGPLLSVRDVTSKGLQDIQVMVLPDFTDDLAFKMFQLQAGRGGPMPGTK